MSKEQEIFDDLARLCVCPGYAHVIAYFCYRDNIVRYKEELKSEDFSKLFSPDRLIRTEISTLLGLMVREELNFSIPTPSQFQELIENTERLLRELHDALNQPFVEALKKMDAESASDDPFDTAEAMREPIFYGSESAFSWQYRDLAEKKYAGDDEWLKGNKGFTIGDARRIVNAIGDFLNSKLRSTLRGLKDLPREEWSALKGFQFSPEDIVAESNLPNEAVVNFLDAFCFANDGNPTFTSLHEFNATNAFPILKIVDGTYALFQYNSLAEALYETPFYWMGADKTYAQVAMSNRGKFAEVFAAERLGHVFGPQNVHRNVTIWASKGKALAEIDVLVLFGNCAAVCQTKSKKLTIESRKGNDLQLQNDFKSAVQDACDQAIVCAEQLQSGALTFEDASGAKITIPKQISKIFPICIVSDHYPALSFQARQFLKCQVADSIRTPLICDVFLLDVVTEFLDSPLRCLSYLELRSMAGDKMIFSHEMTALGYHLKQNLWLGEYDFVQLHDDLSTDLNVAMAVRRDGMPGERTPPGILTRIQGLSIGKIITEIERVRNSAAIDLGLFLLQLSEDTVRDLSRGIDKIATQAAKDGRPHDVTIGVGSASNGITVHCNSLPDLIARPKLQKHCELRKYSQKAVTWFGIGVAPGNAKLRFAVALDNPWTPDAETDKLVAAMPPGLSQNALKGVIKFSKSKKKVGRNDLCPCGSGLKYKKCHLNKDAQ